MRYLVSFDAKKVSHRFADVLIIGGGLAGLRAALEVDPALQVLVITKDQLQQSNSAYAQGGIAGVLDPEDRVEFHVRDTLVAGGNLCDEEVVQSVIQQAPSCIQELVDWGTRFDRQEDQLQLGREGGHSHNRVVHAQGDATGQEIMRAVIMKASAAPNIQILQNAFTIDLITEDDQCLGAVVFHQGQKFLVWAGGTILCTGGAGQVFRETTNPAVATGDGHAMAWRAGAIMRDMEFVQFHPTVLYIAGSSRSLITEAVRGEGAHLVDCNGKRFMPEYDSRAELAPRDIVSQSIVKQMTVTKHSHVYLDMSHLDGNKIRDRFPGIDRACQEFGLDITSDKIPVRPGAHYIIGGVAVDEHGKTSIERLWAAGEATSSGLHGANRLASNSLLEGLVYGIRAGRQVTEQIGDSSGAMLARPIRDAVDRGKSPPIDVEDIQNSLKSLMWRCAAVARNGNELDEALDSVDRWSRYVMLTEFESPIGWELQNMLAVSRMIIVSAQKRTESRGVHLRTDYPDSDDANWRKHVCLRGNELFTCELQVAPG